MLIRPCTNVRLADLDVDQPLVLPHTGHNFCSYRQRHHLHKNQQLSVISIGQEGNSLTWFSMCSMHFTPTSEFTSQDVWNIFDGVMRAPAVSRRGKGRETQRGWSLWNCILPLASHAAFHIQASALWWYFESIELCPDFGLLTVCSEAGCIYDHNAHSINKEIGNSPKILGIQQRLAFLKHHNIAVIMYSYPRGSRTYHG